MTYKEQKQYDKFTIGNSPAAIYLIDLLNKTENNINHNILKSLHKHRDIFNQLLKSYENNHISTQVVTAFCYWC